MVRRLTRNEAIAGSIPAVGNLIFFIVHNINLYSDYFFLTKFTFIWFIIHFFFFFRSFIFVSDLHCIHCLAKCHIVSGYLFLIGGGGAAAACRLVPTEFKTSFAFDLESSSFIKSANPFIAIGT